MPKYQNTVQFSLPSDQLKRLQGFAREGESLGLCAKRIVLGVIDGDRPSTGGTLPGEDFEDWKDRLSALEDAVRELSLVAKELSIPLVKLDQPIEPTPPENSPPLSQAIDRESFIVCHLSPERSASAGVRSILAYWGEGGWVEERGKAKVFDTEAKAKGQVTRCQKKYRDRDIRYNSIARLEALAEN